MQTAPSRYQAPDWFTRHVFNRLVVRLTKMGISLWGSRACFGYEVAPLGQWRSVPVNVLTIAGQDYLVAPRGTTQWVRNLRAAGTGELRVGRRSTEFTAVEVDDADKPAILRPYLERWKWEVGQFFDGVGPDASDHELQAAGQRHPVFAITSR